MSITFTNGENSVTVDNPLYGYTVDVVMSTHKVLSGGQYRFWDDSVSGLYDRRVLKNVVFQLSESQQVVFQDFFNDPEKGRCETVVMDLGETPSGFFPRGPDMGDVGEFVVRLLTQSEGGLLQDPWKYFSSGLDFALAGGPTPAYELPVEVRQGTLAIGAVDELMYPLRGFSPGFRRAYSNSTTQDGTPYSVDGANSADGYDTNFLLSANQSKMAALVNFLSGATGRTADIDIITTGKHYPYGISNGADGTFPSKLLSNILSVTHNSVNDFSLPLDFWMIP
jgi:hypothetical protein